MVLLVLGLIKQFLNNCVAAPNFMCLTVSLSHCPESNFWKSGFSVRFSAAVESAPQGLHCCEVASALWSFLFLLNLWKCQW